MSEYLTRTFWSPCRKYLVTAHSPGDGDLILQDDNGKEWEPTGPAKPVDETAAADVPNIMAALDGNLLR